MSEKQMTIEEKMGGKSKEELVNHVSNHQMQERFLWAKALTDIFGKEQAKKIIRNTVYPVWYDRGRAEAQKMGYPEDVESFAKVLIKSNAKNPITPDLEIVEKTKTKLTVRIRKCFIADAFFNLKEKREDYERFGGDDVAEVTKSRCVMDEARWRGFNPRFRVTRPKFFMDGDGCCEYTLELVE